MGVTGDFVGNLTQHNVQKNQGGSFPGLENLFFPREVEVSFFGQIDPYARAEVRFEAEQDSRGGEPERQPRRGEPYPDGPAVRHAAQAGQDAQPLRPSQPDPRARLALHRQSRRARSSSSARRDSSSRASRRRGCRPCPSTSSCWAESSTARTTSAFGRNQITNPLVTGRAADLPRLRRVGRHPDRLSRSPTDRQPDRQNNPSSAGTPSTSTPRRAGSTPPHPARRIPLHARRHTSTEHRRGWRSGRPASADQPGGSTSTAGSSRSA